MEITKGQFKIIYKDSFKYFSAETDPRIFCSHCQKFWHDDKSMEFLLYLDLFRLFCGFPLYLTCLHRCPVHNACIGSGPHSGHLKAIAADVYNFKYGAYKIFRKAHQFGHFRGIGLYIPNNFVHVDQKNRESLWVCENMKDYTYFNNYPEALAYIEKIKNKYPILA